MSDGWFFVGFFVLLIVLAFSVGNGPGIFSDTSTSTAPREEYVYGTEPTSAAPGLQTLSSQPTRDEIESRIANLYAELDVLKDDARTAKLWGTVSPFAGTVELSLGNAWSTDPDNEYLYLRHTGSTRSSIDISDWYLESYVTHEHAAIPEGDRTLEHWRSPKPEDIYLEPGETAYLITGDSPIDTSFKENLCTGYLNAERKFEPYLTERCPMPLDELQDYERVHLDDDSCYDLVEGLQSCRVPEDDVVDAGDVTHRCADFIDSTLGYNNCVERHRADPFFSRDGYWYVYLEHNDELWRTEREIIRLRDGEDRVVDVLEY